MTILQALDRYYDRMAARGEAESPGFSREKISFAVTLSTDGRPIDRIDLRQTSGKRQAPVFKEVPAAVRRTVAIVPNLFWDKTAYAFGRTASKSARTDREHNAFKTLHFTVLAGNHDPGLVALRLFLEQWKPEHFDAPPFTVDMLDTNIVFRFENDGDGFIHERYAAKRIVEARMSENPDAATAMCLVSGRIARVRRLHPPIKGVEGAQSSGAALVSFNREAFRSYGKDQGDNAPTSEAAAFRYGAALNRMLDRGSRNRIQRTVGDTTIAFWADTSCVGEIAAKAAEDLFATFFDPPLAKSEAADAQAAAKLSDVLADFTKGRPLKEINPHLEEGTRFYILGLAPNAARLSVRFWLQETFEHIANRLGLHAWDLAIEPRPHGWSRPPSIQRLLVKTTALQEKFDNIPPQLAGEVTRAVLTGLPYPRTLLAATITRLRAGDGPGSGWHAAVIKACINRGLRFGFSRYRASAAASIADTQWKEEEVPVALEPQKNDVAYQLGRLFAVLEAAQYAALGRVNAPIGDRYYASASATPARVFGPLLRGLKHHVSDAKKRGKGGWIESKVGEIMLMLPADLPKILHLEDQGRFAVGYYHERATRSAKSEEIETDGEDDAD